MTVLAHRYEFVLLFDVANGNPNGDPDAGNLPRLDPETNHGLVSDVCLKRKIRNFVELTRRGADGFNIYVQDGAILNARHREAYKAIRPNSEKVSREVKLNPQTDEEADRLRMFMCDNFFDIRCFGAVMSTGINCGQVRGPTQMTFAQSIEPILPVEILITRMATTSEKEKNQPNSEDSEDSDERIENRTMGRKYIVPYALYRAHGFVSAKLAERTGFCEDDLDLLFEALENMFEHDRSAGRGQMASRKLFIFKHSSAIGNAHAHDLFDLIKVGRRINGAFREINDNSLENLPPARKFSDYMVTLDRSNLPAGVEIIERLT